MCVCSKIRKVFQVNTNLKSKKKLTDLKKLRKNTKKKKLKLNAETRKYDILRHAVGGEGG